MPDSFYSAPDWECSSGPIVARQFQLVDVWPEGNNDAVGGAGTTDKDTLEDGLHPVLAIGAKAGRNRNLTGVVISYNANANLVTMNLADKFCVRNYVANILTYSESNPATFDQSMAIGEPVFVDDSDDLTPGVTLSRSPLNNAGSQNPLAGYLFYCQDEYQDYGVGGPNQATVWPKTVPNSLDESAYCILLVNDYGETR